VNNASERTPATGEERSPRTLEELRGEIDGIDEQIVSLLARRYHHVQEVVALKKAQWLPVYHPAREEDLISQRREQAQRAGLDPDQVEELYRCILRQSRLKQTVQTSQHGVRPGAKVLIVGGLGRMGRYFGRWFGAAGYEVRVLDIADWPRVGALCAEIDLALVSVPIEQTVTVIERLGPHLPTGCVLTDIASVKKEAVEAMLRAHAGPVIGLHPLFGPTTTTMDKQIVVATPGRSPEECQWVVDQLMTWGNVVVTLEAGEHDEVMSFVQALRHFSTFAFGDFMCRRDVNVGRTLELSSPIYRLELGMIGRLFAQDPTLYAEIIFASPERRALMREYIDSLCRHRQLLEANDKAAFCEEFKRISDWFGPFCEQAMRESNFLIDKLVERF
jgi:chorismate mutase / prephenate dehydrogenase